MRRAVVGLCLASACSIPNDHFVFDGRRASDGSGAGADAHVIGHGYIIDRQTGLWLTNRASDGSLSLPGGTTPTVSYANGMFRAATNQGGTRLYVAAAGYGSSGQAAILDYPVAMDGTLAPAAAGIPSNLSLATSITVSPDGQTLIAVYGGMTIDVFSLGGGQIVPSPSQTQAATTNLQDVAFAGSGCVVFAELGGGISSSTYLGGSLSAPANQAAGGGSGGRLAVEPSGSGVFLLSTGAGSAGALLTHFDIANCALTQSAPNHSIGAGPYSGIAVDPSGSNVYVAGADLQAFTWISSSTTFAPIAVQPAITGNTIDPASVTVDPALPQALYVTGVGFQGTRLVGYSSGDLTAKSVTSTPATMTLALVR